MLLRIKNAQLRQNIKITQHRWGGGGYAHSDDLAHNTLRHGTVSLSMGISLILKELKSSTSEPNMVEFHIIMNFMIALYFLIYCY